MLSAIRNVVLRIWRGAWKPTYVLPVRRRWWHYIDYIGWRSQDIVAALYIFVGFPWIAFFVYEKYSTHPQATVGVAALMSALWFLLIVLAYYKGRPPND